MAVPDGSNGGGDGSAAELLVVGDVHGHWRAADAAFLEGSGCDMAMFVGDLGDEDLDMVRAVVAVDVPKAVILGNHDAWQSFTSHQVSPRLRESLRLLGDDHIGYQVRDLDRAELSIVGARPFSWGGRSLRSPELYRELFGLGDEEESAQRIVDAAHSARYPDLLVLAHNGPYGLSRAPQDIWGKDFGRPGGDWGDRDLRLALRRLADDGLRVRAVVAGHMHSRVMTPRGAARRRFVERNGTLFLNPAVVPRIRSMDDGEHGYFLRLRARGGEIVDVAELWVDRDGRVRSEQRPAGLRLPARP